MTLLEVEELTRYWIDHPPLHLMVAAHLGVGKANRRPNAAKTVANPRAGGRPDGDVGALLAALGPSFAQGDVHAGLAPAVLDFAELQRSAKPTG
ncbi:MAG: hypothetical protein ACREE2_00905 [Stellaceae bacterium]